jgi:hypothetical protein
MSKYQVTAGELIYLLNEAGVERPLTMNAEEFAWAASENAVEPGSEADTLRALAAFLTAPEIVIRVWRQERSGTTTAMWFYWSGDSAVVLQDMGGGSFEMLEISGRQALLDAVESSLAVRPVPADLDFYMVVQREDFLAVRDLADVWDEVPALDIIQADGLDKVTAKELFDVAASPEWRAQVNFSGIRDKGTVERVARVAQGPESAWMALPMDENIRAIRVETVQAGEIAALLKTYWDDVSE